MGRAFSLVEVTMSTLIVGLLLIAALNTVAVSRSHQYSVSHRVNGEYLAEELMAEIQGLPYWDPVAQSGLGPETGETTPGDRTLFDDVDDYDGWSASPPQDRNATAIPGFTGWTRSVTVDWLNSNTLGRVTAESGVKGIVITVEDNGKVVDRLYALQTNVEIGP